MLRITVEFPDQVNDSLKDLASQDRTTKLDMLRRVLALCNLVMSLKLSITDDKNKIIKEIVFL
ncbi:MAG: hypothetical protein EXS64_14270 [Candidatus Latescibacteria bacterium]|nr:hypothetical protein [Candidatus Latescibacterota bacterium]